MIFALYPLLFFAQGRPTSFAPIGPTDRRIKFELEGEHGIADSPYDITVELENAGRVVQAQTHIIETGETEGLVFGLLVGFEQHDIICGIEETTMGLAAKNAEDLVIPNPWTIRSVRVEPIEPIEPVDGGALTAWIRQSAVGFADRTKSDQARPDVRGFASFDLGVLEYNEEGVEIALALRGSSGDSAAKLTSIGRTTVWAARQASDPVLAVLVPFAKELGLSPSISEPDGGLHVEIPPDLRLTEVVFALKQRSAAGSRRQALQYSLNAQ